MKEFFTIMNIYKKILKKNTIKNYNTIKNILNKNRDIVLYKQCIFYNLV